MKKMVMMLLAVAACHVLIACAQVTVPEVETKNAAVVLQEEPVIIETTAIDILPEDEVIAAESSEERRNESIVEKSPFVPDEALVAEEFPSAEPMEQKIAAAPEAETEMYKEESDEEDVQLSEEELQLVLAHYYEWLAEQERQANGGGEYSAPANTDVEEVPVVEEITRSEEEVYQFIANFVANYENTESFRSLDEEGIEYLEDCLNLLSTDPTSDANIVHYMESYQSGFYDDEMFNFILECWVEFAGPFGEGCTIVVY